MKVYDTFAEEFIEEEEMEVIAPPERYVKMPDNQEKANILAKVHMVKENDEDYPTMQMLLVPYRHKYDLMSVDGLIVVPLHQVIDDISEPKADYILQDGVKYCPKCMKPIEAKGDKA